MLSLDGRGLAPSLAQIDVVLADAASVLVAPSQLLVATLTAQQLRAFGDKRFPDRPGLADYGRTVLPTMLGKGSSGDLLGGIFSFYLGVFSYARKRRASERPLTQFLIRRPLLSLTDRERAVLRGIVALIEAKQLPRDSWPYHYAMMAWGGGQRCDLVPVEAFSHSKGVPVAREYLRELLTAAMPSHDAYLASAAQLAARFMTQAGPAGAAAREAATGGEARWMTEADLASSGFYAPTPSPASLFLGFHAGSRRQVWFDGNESLITVGGPNTGKSRCHVMPNLLNFPGSAIVLDVKGELWEATAGYRAQHIGPVYRFAPTDASGRSHRYNPFDAISMDPDEAAEDCTVFSYQVVQPNPRLHDPFWEEKGRDFIWAFAMLVALRAPPHMRNCEQLAHYVAQSVGENAGPGLDVTISELRRLAAMTRIPDLDAAANALAGGRGSTRLESVMDGARRYLAPFSRSSYARAALSETDWTPDQLRRQPGTTVYICLGLQELKVYAPFVRLILYQHLRKLVTHTARRGAPPITFFLDEMPQLGNFESILQMQDVGRGAGLRLWMFAQSVGQLRQAFGDRYKGVIEANRVRCFMQPDTEAAQDFIVPALGDKVDLASGTRRPLAPVNELIGRSYADNVILTTRGDLPMTVEKGWVDQLCPERIVPPPLVAARPSRA